MTRGSVRAILLMGMLLTVGATDRSAHAPARELDWCADNLTEPAEDSEVLTIGMSARDTPRLNLVRWDRQSEARARLTKLSYLVLTRDEAAGLIRDGDRFTTSERVLLVRGAAAFGNSEAGARARIWSAIYSRSARRLSIYSRGPGDERSPRGNVAVLIELDAPVDTVEVVCGADDF